TASMNQTYRDVEFRFEHTDEDEPAALGTVVLEGGRMVLELSEDDDSAPFCRVLGLPAGEAAFAGDNQVQRRGGPRISARWALRGAQATGTWVENDRTYPFSFTLPSWSR
ncbi:MAG TPA: hypothetical protein VFH51_04660, partial [Myxococcota bacterium]|nr:hypothetical protein [Myxococcota bacterium]